MAVAVNLPSRTHDGTLNFTSPHRPLTHSKMAFATAATLPLRSRAGPATSARPAPRACATPLNAGEALPMKEVVDLAAGKKMPVCRCWKSKKHPLCDGSHHAWNKETGDSLGPLVVSATGEE